MFVEFLRGPVESLIAKIKNIDMKIQDLDCSLYLHLEFNYVHHDFWTFVFFLKFLSLLTK